MAHRHGSSLQRSRHPGLCRPTTGRGQDRREIIRCLKRYIAREIFALLTGRERVQHVPDPTDLRPTRLAAGLSLQTVANHFEVWPARISELELGIRRDDRLEQAYRTWLTQQAA